MFFNKSFQLKSDQFVKTHIKYRVGLGFRKGKLCRHDLRLFASESDPAGFTVYKAVLDGLTISGAPQDLDDQVNYIDRFDQSLLDFPLFALLFEKILILSRSRLIEEVRVGFEDFPKAQSFGSAVPDREHIYAECILKACLFVKKIPEIIDIRIFLQLNDDPDPFLVGLVRDVDDIVCDLLLGECGDV